MTEGRAPVLATDYETYLDACNRRDWVRVKAFFGPAFVLNGETCAIEQFIGGLVRQCLVHPDLHWRAVDVRQADQIVTACLESSSGDLSGVEFVQYRSAGPMIVQMWSLGSGWPGGADVEDA